MEKENVVIPRKFIVTEYEFFHTYFNLYNVAKADSKKLTPKEIELAAHLCCYPMSFILDKQRNRNGQSKKIELAGILDIRPQNIYGLLKALVNKGILSIASDNFYEFPEHLNKIRYVVKEIVKNDSHNITCTFQFDLEDG